MAIETRETRVSQLENKVREREELLKERNSLPPKKRGWRAIVGIHENNPRLDEAERLGREWQFAARPKDDEASR